MCLLRELHVPPKLIPPLILCEQQSKAVPTSLVFSQDYRKFVTHSLPDRAIRIFDTLSGKILHRYDESLSTIQELQTAGTTGVKLDEMEFGRRLALEKQLDKEAGEPGAVNAAQGLRTMNAVFDETGHFLIYPTMLGIKGELGGPPYSLQSAGMRF